VPSIFLLVRQVDHCPLLRLLPQDPPEAAEGIPECPPLASTTPMAPLRPSPSCRRHQLPLMRARAPSAAKQDPHAPLLLVVPSVWRLAAYSAGASGLLTLGPRHGERKWPSRDAGQATWPIKWPTGGRKAAHWPSLVFLFFI
jgi:hypothetical protein